MELPYPQPPTPGDAKPCEQIHYLHFLIGGPADGDQCPSGFRYDSMHVLGATYRRTDEQPQRLDDPGYWQVLPAKPTEYAEHVFYRVNLRHELPPLNSNGSNF